MSRKQQLFIIALITLVPVVAPAGIKMPSVFGNGMVLQQQSDVAVWGWAGPGEKINVRGSWDGTASAGQSAVADAEGRWQVILPTAGAGGPYTLTVTGNSTVVLDDVLLGEVWVCSGQSNMEWPMTRTDNSEKEIADADWPDIRLFRVQKNASALPQSECKGYWVSCSPEAVRSFSAVGYFFGRELHRELNVPVGLIMSAWGGTVAEAWTRREVLEELGGFESRLEKLDVEVRRLVDGDAAFNRELERWEKKLHEATGGDDQTWFKEDYDDSNWGLLEVPGRWTALNEVDFDGEVWHRRTIELPAEWEGQELVLQLGKIDDADVTWVNGIEVGRKDTYNEDRTYLIDDGIIRPGRNVISVKVTDRSGPGGFHSEPEVLQIYPKGRREKAIGLAAQWKYKDAVNYRVLGPAPSKMPNPNIPSVLYNGMIRPVVPYGIRGAIWYQGESNRNMAEQYGRLFPAMIQNWRNDWGRGDFPFYYTQLAPYKYDGADNISSALLREAQFKTMNVKNVGMAVTLDIGNVEDIHPGNKLDVGRRLALWALANDYGRTGLVCSGPLYKSMSVEGGSVRLAFDFTDGGLVSKHGELRCFEIAGADREFVEAHAVIEDGTVVVKSDLIKEPKAVRFAFKNGSEPNLFNGAGLPASSFRTDCWPAE